MHAKHRNTLPHLRPKAMDPKDLELRFRNHEPELTLFPFKQCLLGIYHKDENLTNRVEVP